MSSILKQPPPLLLTAACALAAWLLARWLPSWTIDLPAKLPLSLLIFAAGGSVIVLGILEFRRARTTVNPLTPEQTARIVDTGVYRFTRNPMYLGFALWLLALSVWLAHPMALLVTGGFVMWIHRVQIPAEERALIAKFGEAYPAYMQRVRRWL